VIVDANELDAIRERSCTRKTAYGPNRARTVAVERQRAGDDVHPYRCPFCGLWHLGHVMSQEGVEALAEALRFRAYPQGGHIDREAG
jgi:hypothetical protein